MKVDSELTNRSCIINVNEKCAGRALLLEPTNAHSHQSGSALWYRHVADVTDVHAVAVIYGGSINQSVSSDSVPFLWSDIDYGARRDSHRLTSDQNQRSVHG